MLLLMEYVDLVLKSESSQKNHRRSYRMLYFPVGLALKVLETDIAALLVHLPTPHSPAAWQLSICLNDG